MRLPFRIFIALTFILTNSAFVFAEEPEPPFYSGGEGYPPEQPRRQERGHSEFVGEPEPPFLDSNPALSAPPKRGQVSTYESVSKLLGELKTSQGYPGFNAKTNPEFHWRNAENTISSDKEKLAKAETLVNRLEKSSSLIDSDSGQHLRTALEAAEKKLALFEIQQAWNKNAYSYDLHAGLNEAQKKEVTENPKKYSKYDSQIREKNEKTKAEMNQKLKQALDRANKLESETNSSLLKSQFKEAAQDLQERFEANNKAWENPRPLTTMGHLKNAIRGALFPIPIP
jgi:hypothetical protein